MLRYTLDNYRQVPFIIWNYIPQFQPQKRYVGATDEHTFMLFWLLDFDAYPNQQPGRAGRVGHFALIMDRWKIPKLCTPGLDRRLAKHIPAAVYIYTYLMASYMLESNLQSLLNLLVPNMGVCQTYYYHILREYTSIKPAISGT